MELFNEINKRKSCRKYKSKPFSNERLNEIKKAIQNFSPLYPDVKLDFRFVRETKGMFHVEAPHYLIVSGQGKDGEQENAGFIYEQLVLWFSLNGIGCVWLGKSKDIKDNNREKDIITIAFGEADEPLYRKESEFRRKSIDMITNIPDDKCIKSVLLAPSGMNLQPWFFEKKGNKIIVYEQIIKPPLSFTYKLTNIDMGIALCHYALACEHYDKPFMFQRKNGVSEKKGYKLFGELSTNM